jgi:betaine lipid synthase
VKSYNGRNRFILPFIVRMFVYLQFQPCLLASLINFSNSPYYIWLGRPRSCDVTRVCHAFEIEGGNLIGNCSPTISRQETKDTEFVPPLEIGEPVMDVQQLASNTQTVIDISPPLSSFHYQVNKVEFFPVTVACHLQIIVAMASPLL